VLAGGSGERGEKGGGEKRGAVYHEKLNFEFFKPFHDAEWGGGWRFLRRCIHGAKGVRWFSKRATSGLVRGIP